MTVVAAKERLLTPLCESLEGPRAILKDQREQTLAIILEY